MEKRFYKVGLSVNLGDKVNLEENFEEIVKAAMDFTDAADCRKVLTISSIKNNFIRFLISLNVKNSNYNFTIRSIAGFLKSLCSLFNLQYDSKKHYFFVEEYTFMSQDDYISLYKDSCINIGKLIKEKSLNADKDLKNEEDFQIDDSTENSYENLENLQIPKRSFPIINTGVSRINDKKDEAKVPTLQDSMKQLNNLIGLEAVKKQIKDITSFIIKSNERSIRLGIDNLELYYNTAISGNSGTGKNTLAKILFNIYYNLGVIGNGKFIIIDGIDVWPRNTLDRYIGNAQSGVILINDFHLALENNRPGQKDVFATIDEWCKVYKNNFVFIFAGEIDGMAKLMKNPKIKNHINFYLNISDFNEEESIELIKYFAAKERYTIDNESDSILTKYIKYLKEKDLFENTYTARRIVNKAIVKHGAIDIASCLTSGDFYMEDIDKLEDENKTLDISEADIFKELDGMIGLYEVKKRIKEITAYVKTQLKRKKLGLKSEPICLHMSFVGNPGTGKTSVARCIGKILKNIGALSKGQFIEASREDLVGAYIGQTALKTADKIKEAEGGVLFIDEAYSLNSFSKRDYGYEVISTLVKKMEDLRDNLVVIFAGYPEEMSGFISMNPGLKDRVQFKLEFKDYKAGELLDIWKKFFSDSGYEIDMDALYEMEKISHELYENKNSSFSNGRIIRKCFERAKIHQAVRIINSDKTETEEFIKITSEDIESLNEDEDLAEILHRADLKKCIGFNR